MTESLLLSEESERLYKEVCLVEVGLTICSFGSILQNNVT